MFKIFVALLVLIAGVAAEELCDESMHRVCRNEKAPKQMPRTAEELQEFCTIAIGFFECGVKHARKCDKSNMLGEVSNYLKIFQEICDPDTLLYEAIRDNVQCFSELMEGGAGEECHRQHRSPSHAALQKYATVLIEEGLLEENNTFYTMACIHMLQELACYAMKLEDNCGQVAVNTYVEVALKFSSIAECGETFHYLPTIIRVYKVVEEEANETEEVFKKKK